MFELFIKVVFWLVRNVSSLIFTPIIEFLSDLFPNLTNVIENVETFLSNYIFNTLKWTKMFLMNCTAFPETLFNFIVSVFIIMVAMHSFLTIYECGLRLYKHFKP